MNTTYFLDLVSGNLFRTKTDPPIPTEFWIGLSTTAPNIDGTNVTEPSASAAYQRLNLTSLSAPAEGVVTNNADIDWPESTAGWGVITSYVIFDSPTVGSGNLLIYGDLVEPRTVERGTIMTVKANYLKLKALNPTASV